MNNLQACWLLLAAACPIDSAVAQDDARRQDLFTPEAVDAEPAPGKRVRQFNPSYVGTDVYHLLYLPTDWKPEKTYPVIVEYAGNKYREQPGTVENSNMGYGISGGKSVIWVCMPYVNRQEMKNQVTWWGDVDATIEYCQETVKRICDNYGGDRRNVFIAGFSRGAIACNYIGLYNDEIASLWRGFICHSHYDGVKEWPHADSDRASAAKRLARLGDRPQYISHEKSTEAVQQYLAGALPDGNFSFQPLIGWGHTDRWLLYDVPERTQLRQWFRRVIDPSQDPK